MLTKLFHPCKALALLFLLLATNIQPIAAHLSYATGKTHLKEPAITLVKVGLPRRRSDGGSR